MGSFQDKIMRIDEEFFAKHQRTLLWIANSWVGRRYFKITEHPMSRVFTHIEPFALYWEQDGSTVAEFRTSNRYANRIKHSARWIIPILQAAATYGVRHATADAGFLLSMPLVFGTVGTFYPDGTPSTTCDGFVRRDVSGAEETWATIRGGAGTTATTSPSPCYLFHLKSNASKWAIITRAFWLFPTSTIGAGQVVSSAILSFYGNDTLNTLSASAAQAQLNVVTTTPASNTSLATGDYGNVGSVSKGTLAFASFTLAAYNDITLNDNSVVNITGITKLGTRSGADLNNSEPTVSAGVTHCFLDCVGASAAGTTQDPKLTVTYAPAGSLAKGLLVNQAIKRAALY